jgi:nitrite reductase (NADH) small subunit
MAEKTLVCQASDIHCGSAHIVKLRNLSIGLFRIGESVHAMLNLCPHRGAPLCEGIQCGTTATVDNAEFVYHRENEIVRCAWHGWEFDIRTGASLVDPKVKARTFPVTVEGDDVFITA